METYTHAAAIIEALEAQGLVVGDHAAPAEMPTDPKDPGWAPYNVLYMTAGGSVDGTAAHPDEDFDFRFQITSVARLPGEAQHQSDLAYDALTAGPLTVAGRFVQRIRPISPFDGVLRDENGPTLFYAVRAYGATSFPDATGS